MSIQRERQRALAQAKLTQHVDDVAREFNLSFAEIVGVFAGILATWAKYERRAEDGE